MNLLEEIDKVLMKQGVKFDSSINCSLPAAGKYLYFNDGLIVAEVEVQADRFGNIQINLFKTEKKLWK